MTAWLHLKASFPVIILVVDLILKIIKFFVADVELRVKEIF